MSLAILRLKKNEDRRIRAGHLWIYSNEIDTTTSPLKSFSPGQEVRVEASDKTPLGIAYINPHSLIAARLVTRNVHQSFDTEFLIQKIQSALSLRERIFVKPFYRLVFGESDGLPGLVADRFGNTLVLQINTAGMDLKKDAIIAACREVIPDLQAILLRNDSSARVQEGLETYVSAAFGTPDDKVLLEENNTLFNAPLWSGQKTGWFYDHRLNRTRLKEYVNGKRVLDVFSYLGAWGIQAALAGAQEVHCVDSSPLSAEWIHANAELNGVANKTHIITEDAFVALKNLHQAKEKFDVIVLDPPAFAKKQKDRKEGLLAYQRINELALKLLVPDGILISCSCSMQISFDDFCQSIRRASLGAGCELQLLERGHQAQDHPVHFAIPETDYLKMVIARRVESGKNQGRC
jgi:23S rRNA (cytosine1962-C5)-methyltransferase